MKSRKVQLAEVITVERTAASEAECRSLPYVGLEHIERDTGQFTADFHRTPEMLLATKYRFTPRHVLYGKLRPNLNKTTLPDFDGVCTTEILPLLPQSQTLDRGYLFGVLLSKRFVKWASNSVSGANLPRLDPDRLLEYEVELPDLSKQRSLAEKLSQADRLRRARRYALELTDTFLPAAFLELFGCLHENDKNWSFVQLEESAEIVSGVAKGQRYGDAKTLEVPYLRVANVQDGYLDLSEIKTIRVPPREVESLRLQAGDVVMTEGGDFDKLGRGAIWSGGVTDCIHQNHIFRVRLNRSALKPRFFAAFLRSSFAKSYFLRCSKQTTNLASINMTQLRATPTPLPPLPLQEKFSAMVEGVDRLRAAQKEALRHAEHLFASLLDRAFKGD